MLEKNWGHEGPVTYLEILHPWHAFGYIVTRNIFTTEFYKGIWSFSDNFFNCPL